MRSDVHAWALGLVESHSVSTARQALGVLRQILALPTDDGVLPRNVAVGVRLPRTPRSEPQPLSHSDLWALAGAMDRRRDRLMVLVAGYGGLRWGELTALGPRDVTGSEVLVSKAYADVAGQLILGPTKTHAVRRVPLPPVVAAELRSWATGCSTATLFASAAGSPLRNRNWRRDVLTPTSRKTLRRNVTPHQLRDTAASLAIGAGASVVAVARMLGHDDATTTLRHYAASFPSDLDHVALRLEGQIAAEAAQSDELRSAVEAIRTEDVGLMHRLEEH